VLKRRTFELALDNKAITPAAGLSRKTREVAEYTIGRLGLDSAQCRRMRSDRWQQYLDGHVSAVFLRRYSPFVWREARRQNRLLPT
jgi:hypothetical protein